MSLQTFTSSRFCKSVAGFLFGLMILSACQETAQVVNKSAEKLGERNEHSIGARHSDINLSEVELEDLSRKILTDPNSDIITKNYNDLLIKLKIATSNESKRVQLELAMKNKDYNQALIALEMSDEELKGIASNIETAVVNLRKNLGQDYEKIASILQKIKCQTCEQATEQDRIKSIINADIIPSTDELLKRMKEKGGSNLQNCSWWIVPLLPFFIALCLAAFVGGALIFPLAYWWMSPSQQQEILNMLHLPNCIELSVNYLCSLQ